MDDVDKNVFEKLFFFLVADNPTRATFMGADSICV